MKKLFEKKEKTYSGSEVDKALERSNPFALKQAIREVNQANGGIIWIGRKASKSDAAARVGEIDIADAISDDSIVQSIHDKYKDGLYLVRIYHRDGKIHSDHHFLLGSMGKKKKKDDGEEKEPKAAKGYYGAIMQQNTELIKMHVEGKNNGGLDVKSLLEMQQAGFDRQIETIKLMMSQGGSSLDEALAIIQISQQLQPHVEKEEPMMQLFTSLAPMVGQLLAARRGGGQPQYTQEQVALLQQQVANLASSTGTQSGPVTRQPPAPGESSSPPGDGRLEGQEAGTEQAPADGSQQYFMENYLEPFRRDVAEGQDVEALAYKIVEMVQYSRDRMAADPPLIMRGFLAADTMEQHDTALQTFFAAIPELSNLRPKQEGIRNALIMMFMKGEQPGEPVVVQEAEAAVQVDQSQVIEEAQIDAASREFVSDAETETGTTVPD